MRLSLRGPLLRFVDFQRDIRVEGSTVEAALQALCKAYPALHPVLFDAEGRIRPVHRLALNSRMITGAELATSVSPDDRVDIITSIAGG